MLLSGPKVLVLGSVGNFTLDVAYLKSLLVNDVYFQEPGFWKEVNVLFKHEASNQKLIINFNASDKTVASISGKAQTGTWKIDSVVVMDYDNGEYALGKTNIPNPDSYNITVSAT
jgi:hypothetical protein